MGICDIMSHQQRRDYVSLDGMALRALSQELHSRLAGGRVDKITQPGERDLVIHIRVAGKTERVLFSINPQNARLTLSQKTDPGLREATLFCMVLRKHLMNAQLLAVAQQGYERMVHLDFTGRNEIGDETQLTLIAELMGRSSNIILVNSEGLILDAMRRVGSGTNKYRQIQPGLAYVPPPAQDKKAIDDLADGDLSALILANESNKNMRNLLVQTLAGIGPQTAEDLLLKSSIDPDGTADYLGAVDYARLEAAVGNLAAMARHNSWTPTILWNGGEPVAFAPFSLAADGGFSEKKYDSMSQAVDLFYTYKVRHERFLQKQGNLLRTVQKETERCEKKLSLQLEKLDEAQYAERDRLYGELLTAQLYRLKQGSEAIVPNFYDPEQANITIPMDPTKSPNENAQRYFKRYNRAKSGAEKAAVQAEQTRQEIAYLESIRESLDLSEELAQIKEIRSELEDAGYLKRQVQKKGSKAEAPAPPLTVQYKGYTIMIGRNNKQNDRLTLRTANGGDLWLHTKEIHGAHVIVRHQREASFPDEVKTKAAELAAWFSKARYSAQVPVDATLKKYVHKPKGAKPGMVIYTDQETLYVTPDEGALKPLLTAAEKDKEA